MNLHEILPSKIRMLEEFMDGGEAFQERKHWNPATMKRRRDYSPEEKEDISHGRCPKCRADLVEEFVISGGEKGTNLYCRSCGNRVFPDEPVDTTDYTAWFKHHKVPPTPQEYEVHCLFCGIQTTRICNAPPKYCSEKCYLNHRRIRNRKAYHKRNNH